MITGVVNSDLEAMVRLVIVGVNQRREVEAVIDTGFTGCLTLTAEIVSSLGLVWLGREEGVLADGHTAVFDVYRAVVVGHGQERVVEVEAAQGGPLLGMGLLNGSDLRIRVAAGGEATVTLPG
jgi:clan AA aspartic protease